MRNAYLKSMLPAAALALAVGGAASVAGAQSVTVGIDSPPRTMEPNGAGSDANMSIVSNMFEGLLQRDAAGNLHPALATKYERINPVTWRFHLRKGVKFHNGNDFTVDDVKFSLARVADPKISQMVNFGALIESIKTVGGDPWVIDIKTKKPVPFFVQNTHQVFMMDKESTEGRDPAQVGQNPIGTGAYRFVEWVKGSHLKMEANPDYWGGAPAVKNATFKPVTEASTAMAAIMSGAVDILQGVPVTSVDVIEKSPNATVLRRPARRAIYLGMANREGSPTSDVRVRKAIYLAINEEEIIDKVMFGHATLAAQIPDPPTVGYSKTIKRLSFDSAKAKALLAEAGYPNGFSVTLDAPNNRYVQDEEIAATVASQLAKVGIKVTVNARPKSVFFADYRKHLYSFYLAGWFDGSYDFARSFGKMLHTADKEAGYGSSNGANYSNPVLDKLHAETMEIIDVETRNAAVRKLNEETQKFIGFIPLHYQENLYAVTTNRKIKFEPRADTWIVFKDIKLGG